MITKQEIEAAKTEKGGWTKQQLAIWGVPWPPESGWQKKLISGETVSLPPKLSKRKRQKMAGKAGIRNKFMMCRIWINAGFPNPYMLKNDEIAGMIANHFNLDLGKEKVQEIIDWAKITSPALLLDTRSVSRAATKLKAASRKVVSSHADQFLRPSIEAKAEFYRSWEWRTLRKQVLNHYGARCQCCGATPNDIDVSGKPVRIVVDHIKPLAGFWSLRLERSNLQILCDECNQGAGAWDHTDHRPKL